MEIPDKSHSPRFVVANLRWWIGALLFASTVINYIDRQTLNVLAPYLKGRIPLDQPRLCVDRDCVSPLVCRRAVDRRPLGGCAGHAARFGPCRGVVFGDGDADILGQRTRQLLAFRFLFGAGEAANWPGATKAVSEWFPAKERSIAVALFDSGSAIGGAVAPALVVWLFPVFGTWRPAFLITGSLGFLWLLAWMATYRRPEEHPLISDSERAMILKTRSGADETPAPHRAPVCMLLWYRQTWGVILAKAILDPYWFLVADWFALFLVSRGFKLEEHSPVSGFRLCARIWEISWAGDCPATSFIGVGVSGRRGGSSS